MNVNEDCGVRSVC